MSEPIWTTVTVQWPNNPNEATTEALASIEDELANGEAWSEPDEHGRRYCNGEGNYGQYAIETELDVLAANGIEWTVSAEAKYEWPGEIVEWRIGLDEPRHRTSVGDFGAVVDANTFARLYDAGGDMILALTAYYEDLPWTADAEPEPLY